MTSLPNSKDPMALHSCDDKIPQALASLVYSLGAVNLLFLLGAITIVSKGNEYMAMADTENYKEKKKLGNGKDQEKS